MFYSPVNPGRFNLSERVGRPIEFPRLQTGGPKYAVSDLSPAALAAVKRFCAPDYRFLQGLYEPPAG